MKSVLLLLAWVVLVLSGDLVAAESVPRISKPAVRDEVVAVIGAQLAAFRDGDLEKAYRCAALALQRQTSLRAFGRLIQASYPEIWQNTRAEFGVVRDDGDHAFVIVHVYAKDGDAAYDYLLSKESAGWRIRGVLRHESGKEGSI